VDHGANGCMTGDDVIVIERGVNGVDTHIVQDLPICKSAIQVQCTKIPVIVIKYQFTYFGKGKQPILIFRLI